MRRFALILLAACGDSAPDPCASATDACITLNVTSDVVDELDQLELDILYGEKHDTITTALPENSIVQLPLVTSINLELAATVPVGVVAAGKLAGNVLGVGASEQMVAPGTRVTMDIKLGPKSTCMTGGDYCGGNELAGEKDTLYRCTDGVPVARGRCVYGCTIAPPNSDDFCEGGPDPCTLNREYCGGNKLDGDPSSVYTCDASKNGTARMMCAKGCVIEPSPADDHCR